MEWSDHFSTQDHPRRRRQKLRDSSGPPRRIAQRNSGPGEGYPGSPGKAERRAFARPEIAAQEDEPPAGGEAPDGLVVGGRPADENQFTNTQDLTCPNPVELNLSQILL